MFNACLLLVFSPFHVVFRCMFYHGSSVKLHPSCHAASYPPFQLITFTLQWIAIFYTLSSSQKPRSFLPRSFHFHLWWELKYIIFERSPTSQLICPQYLGLMSSVPLRQDNRATQLFNLYPQQSSIFTAYNTSLCLFELHFSTLFANPPLIYLKSRTHNKCTGEYKPVNALVPCGCRACDSVDRVTDKTTVLTQYVRPNIRKPMCDC